MLADSFMIYSDMPFVCLEIQHQFLTCDSRPMWSFASFYQVTFTHCSLEVTGQGSPRNHHSIPRLS